MSHISCKTVQSSKDGLEGLEGDLGKLCTHGLELARIPPRTLDILTFEMITRGGRGSGRIEVFKETLTGSPFLPPTVFRSHALSFGFPRLHWPRAWHRLGTR